MNEPKIIYVPAFDRLHVKRDETIEEKQGIYLPDSQQEKPNTGIVTAIGSSCKFAWVGQHIVFGQFHGIDIELGGEIITLLREGDIYSGESKLAMTTEQLFDALAAS